MPASLCLNNVELNVVIKIHSCNANLTSCFNLFAGTGTRSVFSQEIWNWNSNQTSEASNDLWHFYWGTLKTLKETITWSNWLLWYPLLRGLSDGDVVRAYTTLPNTWNRMGRWHYGKGEGLHSGWWLVVVGRQQKASAPSQSDDRAFYPGLRGKEGRAARHVVVIYTGVVTQLSRGALP